MLRIHESQFSDKGKSFESPLGAMSKIYHIQITTPSSILNTQKYIKRLNYSLKSYLKLVYNFLLVILLHAKNRQNTGSFAC